MQSRAAPREGGVVASELGGSQISTLLETLPGIANVLRSPVADALGGVIRAGAGIGPFAVADAEELIRYATRRGLLGGEEGERLLGEVRAAEARRLEKAAERDRAQRAKAAKPKARVVRRASAVKPAAKPVKKATKGAKRR
jgi:hypothetical protein